MSVRKPQFSVVIPVYNRAHSVLPALRSVQTQTCADFECIVVDDGSQDGEALKDVVLGLQDNRFHYVRQDNGGAPSARNLGVRLAKGRFVAFLDSDDLFLPNKLEHHLEFSKVVKSKAYYAQAILQRGVKKTWVRPDRPIRPEEDMGEYLFVSKQFVQTSTMVVETELAKDFPFDVNLKKMQDPHYAIVLARAGHVFAMVPEALVIWNDAPAPNRISTNRITETDKLYAAFKPLLTPKADAAFRAVFLAPELGWNAPILAASYLADALMHKVLSPGVFARQVLRTYLPRSWYRSIADRYISVFGNA